MKTSNYQKYTSKNPIQRFLIENFFSDLLTIVCNIQLRTILDVGCGEGFTLAKLEKNQIGKRLEGIDYSLDAVETGKKLHPTLILKQGNIYTLPYRDKTFDLVVCTEVLEHLEHPEKALKEILRVSKKYCLLSVPNEPLFMIANFIRGKNWSRWGNDIGHIQHWSSKSFEDFVEGMGLRALITKTPSPWTLILGGKNDY